MFLSLGAQMFLIMRFKSLRAWGSNSEGLESFDDPVRGGSPPITPNPMIIERDNPVKRGNARDPSINKMIYYRIERGGIIV